MKHQIKKVLKDCGARKIRIECEFVRTNYFHETNFDKMVNILHAIITYRIGSRLYSLILVTSSTKDSESCIKYKMTDGVTPSQFAYLSHRLNEIMRNSYANMIEARSASPHQDSKH